MNLEGFCSGMGEGRSLAIDSQECVNFYPEIHGQAMYGQMIGSATGKAKAPIVLIGTPGLKLFANFEPVVSVELPPLVCIRDFESGNTGNDIVLTTDGIYWTPHDSKLGDIAPFGIFWDGLQFVFYGDNGNHSDWPYGGVIATSPDGKVWNSVVYNPPEVGTIMKRIIKNPADKFYVGIADVNNGFITQDGCLFKSNTNDFSDWSIETTHQNFASVAFGNSKYVAVGAGGIIYTSTAGANWISATSGTTNNIRKIVFANNKFYAGADDPLKIAPTVLLVSSNGTAWSVLASFDTGTQIYDIAYGNEILTIAAILPDPSDPWAIRKFRIQKRSLNDGADWEAIVSSVLPQVDPNIFFDSTLSMFFTNVIATTSIHKSADAKTWIECYKAPDADNIYDIGTRYGGEGFASK